MTNQPDQIPDQPDGIDMDSFDLPKPEDAATRVALFLEWYGDGRVETLQDGPRPLYARDLWALTNAVRDLLWLHAESRHVAYDLRGRLTESQLDVMARGREIVRLRREVEFEANGTNPNRAIFEIVKPALRDELLRLTSVEAAEAEAYGVEPRQVCACASEEQIAGLRAGGFGPPQCSVHLDGGAPDA